MVTLAQQVADIYAPINIAINHLATANNTIYILYIFSRAAGMWRSVRPSADYSSSLAPAGNLSGCVRTYLIHEKRSSNQGLLAPVLKWLIYVHSMYELAREEDIAPLKGLVIHCSQCLVHAYSAHSYKSV